MKKEIVATGPQQHNLWRGLFNFDLVSKKNSRFSSSLTYLFFFKTHISLFLFAWQFYFLFFFYTTIFYAACLVQRSGWTKDMDTFLQWLSAIPFSGGGFNDAAVAEGLAEALVVCFIDFKLFKKWTLHLYCCHVIISIIKMTFMNHMWYVLDR